MSNGFIRATTAGGTLLDSDYPVFNNTDVLDFDQTSTLPLAGSSIVVKI